MTDIAYKKGGLSDEEVAEYNALEVRLKGFDLAPLPEGILDDGIPLFATGTNRTATAEDATVLRSDESMAKWVNDNVDVPDEQRGLKFGKLIRGATTSRWDDADKERRALAESIGSSGGFLVPALLSAQVIDLARSKSAMIGRFTTVPMTSSTLKIPKLASEPAIRRGEGDAFAEGDLTFGATELQSKGMGVFVKASLEVIEDSAVPKVPPAAIMVSGPVSPSKYGYVRRYRKGVFASTTVRPVSTATIQQLDGSRLLDYAAVGWILFTC